MHTHKVLSQVQFNCKKWVFFKSVFGAPFISTTSSIHFWKQVGCSKCFGKVATFLNCLCLFV